MSLVLFGREATCLLGKSQNDMVKGFLKDRDEDEFLDEFNVTID